MFNDKVLLISGGTGSFGNAVLKRFLNSDIKEIRIFSRDEKKQHDMREKFHHEKLKFYLGDVRDYNSIKSSMIDSAARFFSNSSASVSFVLSLAIST